MYTMTSTKIYPTSEHKTVCGKGIILMLLLLLLIIFQQGAHIIVSGFLVEPYNKVNWNKNYEYLRREAKRILKVGICWTFQIKVWFYFNCVVMYIKRLIPKCFSLNSEVRNFYFFKFSVSQMLWSHKPFHILQSWINHVSVMREVEAVNPRSSPHSKLFGYCSCSASLTWSLCSRSRTSTTTFSCKMENIFASQPKKAGQRRRF